MYKIHFVPPALAWFKHPKPDPRFHHPSQLTPDLIGLWDPAIKRPTTDRHFTPSTPSSEDIRERFLSCPPSVCSDSALKALLESKPLTRSVSGKKELALPGRMFNKTHVNFKETPLFAITQHQSKLALGNTAAMAQLCSGMQDLLSWLVANWDNPLDISSYKGSSLPGSEAVAPSPHSDSVSVQIQSGLLHKSTWLPDLLTHLRDGLQVVGNGLQSSMEYNAATMVASSHAGRELVLNQGISQRTNANWKEQLLNSTYNCEFLFGDLPLSSQTVHAHDKTKGDICVKGADLPAPFKREANKFPPAKAHPKATSSGGSSGYQGSRPYAGQPFRHKGREFNAKPRAQEPKVTPPPPPKPKHPKKGRKRK